MKRTILLPIALLTMNMPFTALMAEQYNSNQDLPASIMPVENNDAKKDQMDPVNIILEDHARIRKMLTELETNLSSNIAESRKQFKVLEDFIVKHETMEQKAFYPELEKNTAFKKIIVVLKQEEDNAGKTIKVINGIKDDQAWAKKVQQFKQAVEKHAEDEENKLLPEVRKTLSAGELNDLGKKLKDYRTQHGM